MRCPNCGKNGGHRQEGKLLRCGRKSCGAVMDPRDDGEVYQDPTKRARLHESRHHEKVHRQQQLRGGL